MRFLIAIAFVLNMLTAMPRAAAQDTTRLSLLFAGDIMGHDSQIAAAYDATTRTYDYASCFQWIKPYLESADVAIGNLELTLAGPPFKGYPQFSSPDALAFALKDAGFDVLVTANNHSVDRGGKGIDRTILMLDSIGMPHTGTFVDEVSRLNDYPLIINRNGFRLALLNYTFSTNGIPVPKPYIVNPIDTAQIHKDLERARSFAPDATIVFIHWGTEYESQPRKQQRDIAAFCWKHGANMVIGAHPHVLQPMRWIKEQNRFVVYSLGNFVSGQRKVNTDGGGMVRLELQKIFFAHDSATTTIDSAAYLLQWVYRTADTRRDYYVLPVNTFENDTLGFIQDAASKLAFRTFAKLSRELLDKHNVGVTEYKRAITSVATHFTVRVELDSGAQDWRLLPAHLDFWSARDTLGEPVVFAGKFADEKDASRYAAHLTETGMVAGAQAVPLGEARKED